MTNTQRSKTVVCSICALILLAGGRDATAQVMPPPIKITPADLAKTDTFKQLKDGFKKLKELNDKKDQWYKDLEKLDPEDDQYEPEYELPGAPDLPSMCKNSRDCEDCYKKPYADLQSTRFRFDKLRRINRVTKNMLRDSLAFGDSVAGSAGVGGLAWVKEREKIVASEQTFNQSYDAKYAELVATLKNNLLDISACEAKIFGNDNWYDRFGFFYQNFMAEAYRRPN